MISLYKVSVNLDKRSLELIVKPGVVATMEIGSYENKVEKPKNKLTVIVGEGKNGLAAWVQAGKIDDSKTLHISHEGWVLEGEGKINAMSSGESIFASLTRVASPSEDMRKCQEKAAFGLFDCCIAYGNGCYVRCCNSCCADPVGCPGASCCG